MPQFFNNDPKGKVEEKIFNAYKPNLEQTEQVLLDALNNMYGSKFLGTVLFEGNGFDLAENFNKEFVSTSYNEIVRGYQKLGTKEGYIILLRAFFGNNVDVEFLNPSPAYLIINADITDSTLDNWTTKSGDNLVDKQGNNLVFKKLFRNLSPAESKALLQKIVPIGIYVEFNITINGDPFTI